MIVLILTIKPIPAIPNPTLPNPNAFDTFRQAAAQSLDSGKIGYAYQPLHSSKAKDDREYTLEERRALLKENLPALDLIRDGLKQEYWNPPVRSVKALFPYYADFRNLARLLDFEAHMKEEQGDWNGVMETKLDCIRMGIQIPHGSCMIGGLVGIAIQSIGRSRAGKAVSHLSAAEAKQAAKRLESIIEGRFAWADTIQEDTWTFQASMNESVPPIPVFRELAIGRYLESARQMKEHIKKPYSKKTAKEKLHFSSISKEIDDTYLSSHFNDALNRALNQMLLTELALQAYRMEHGGAYPNSLSELSPAYLKSPVSDPFNLEKELAYRRTGAGYSLYSFGPDCKDDGGKAIDNPDAKAMKKSAFARYQPAIDSDGDIVAGVNEK